MISETMCHLGRHRSVIREIFEYSKQRSAEIGADRVFDFSLGNPNVPAPPAVNQTIRELLDGKDDLYLHGYTSAQGDAKTRQTIAEDLNRRFQTSFHKDNLYLTCGAAASLKIALTALCLPGDEVITFTPFFPEYRVFVETSGARLKAVETQPDTFQLDFSRLEAAITEKTKAVIVNSPNNPSGVVFRREAIQGLAQLLQERSQSYGHIIYLISDEPYRELVYEEDLEVPYLTKYYQNTLVGYSFSKSLSLPGERIGYLLVPDEVENSADVYAAVCGAGRALGYVCAPSLFQHVLTRCMGLTSDLQVYRRNRDLLYESLSSYGFTCVHPDGAFYLFMKSPQPDAQAFCDRARKHELLLVPADSFGTPSYVRIAYCVSTDQISRSLPAFQALAREYQLDISGNQP